MRKSTQRLFKQLEESRKAKTFKVTSNPYLDAYLSLERPSAFPKGTLGYFADQIQLSRELLMGQFSDAGIVGLSASHRITEDDKRVLLNYLRDLHRSPRPEQLYVDTASVEQQIIVVQAISDDLLKHLAREPRKVFELAPRKFEELIARILEDQGCEVTLTKQSRDGGYDILGEIKSGPVPLVFLAECKRYAEKNRVGVEVVRGLYGITEMQRANFAMIVTTSSFTRDAREEKLRIGPRLHLKEFNDLKTWLQKYRTAN